MLGEKSYTVSTYVALLTLIARNHSSLPSLGRKGRVEDGRDLHGKNRVSPSRLIKRSRHAHSRQTFDGNSMPDSYLADILLMPVVYLGSYMPVSISAKLSYLAYFQPTYCLCRFH